MHPAEQADKKGSEEGGFSWHGVITDKQNFYMVSAIGSEGGAPKTGAGRHGVVMIRRLQCSFMNFQHRALARLTPLASKWSRPLAMVLVLAWLAWALAQWTWQLLPAPSETLQAPSSPPPPASKPALPKLAESINAAALWGRPQVADAGSAQDTRLPLTLRGVLAGQGLALIAASGQPERVYRQGDSLPGGATLRAVHEDHVLLERAGVLERLALPKPQLGSGASRPSLP
ncbi:MAG TPA: hypothetical protein ENO16_07090, partial [Chromatiales bacterium]|nr:hypothetical protein [Chromatiales bacterium]